MTFSELSKKVAWFNNIFGDVILQEGWHIYATIRDNIVVIHAGNNRINMDEIVKIAGEYGWTVKRVYDYFDFYIAVDFDINKLTRNKHLISANELGLI